MINIIFILKLLRLFIFLILLIKIFILIIVLKLFWTVVRGFETSVK